MQALKKILSVILLTAMLLILPGCIYAPNTSAYVEPYEYYIQSSVDKTYANTYQKIYTALINSDLRITFDLLGSTLTEDIFNAALTDVLNDHPEIFWVDTDTPADYSVSEFNHVVISAKFNYTIEGVERTIMQTALDGVRGNARTELTGKTGTALLDGIAAHFQRNIKYSSTTEYAHTAYGALVLGSACCDGISKAAQLIIRDAGYSAAVVKGTVDIATEAHEWLVATVDGSPYYVDFTYTISNPNETFYAKADDSSSIFALHYTPFDSSMKILTNIELANASLTTIQNLTQKSDGWEGS